ncbi:LysM peptidoglycan-binding domain-containing protein [Nocardioides dilutus]
MSTLTIGPAFRPVPLAPRSPRSTVRLTRRGRVVVFLLSLVLAFAIGILVAAGSVATGEAGTPEPTRVVTVSTGDTLWGIAADLADDGDVQAMITRIERLNALDSGMLSAGQRLVVPAD